MDTILLIISLVIALIGIPIIILRYQKDKTSDPHVTAVLTKRILFLTLLVTVLNFINPGINHFKPKPPPPVTTQEVKKLFEEYMGEKPKNPSLEEVQSEIERELQIAFKKKKKRALELYQKGNLAYKNNQSQEAISYFDLALGIIEIPSLYLSRGNSYFVSSDYKSALQDYNTALDRYRNNNNRMMEGRALGTLGSVYGSLGQYDKTIEYHIQALTIAREIGDRRGEGNRLDSLGNVYDFLGQYDKAIEYHAQALTIAREIGDRRREGTNLGNLGLAYGSLCQYDKAIEYHAQAMTIAREIGNR